MSMMKKRKFKPYKQRSQYIRKVGTEVHKDKNRYTRKIKHKKVGEPDEI